MKSLKDVHESSRLATLLEKKKAELAEKYPRGLPPEPTETCPRCNGAGELVRKYDPTDLTTEIVLIPCPACREGQVVRQRQEISVLRRSGLEGRELTTFAGVPALPGQEDAWEIAQDYASYPQGWIMLNGTYYTGKTVLATCIANEWRELGKSVLFRHVPDLLEELRSSYREAGEGGYSNAFGDILNVPCLVMDDYGKQQETPWSSEKLFQITDHRMENALPTVITTNFSLGELERRNPRLYRRLTDTQRCTVVQFRNEPIER